MQTAPIWETRSKCFCIYVKTWRRKRFSHWVTSTSTSSVWTALLTSTSKFNLTPNCWASKNGPDHSLTLSKTVAIVTNVKTPSPNVKTTEVKFLRWCQIESGLVFWCPWLGSTSKIDPLDVGVTNYEVDCTVINVFTLVTTSFSIDVDNNFFLCQRKGVFTLMTTSAFSDVDSSFSWRLQRKGFSHWS